MGNSRPSPRYRHDSPAVTQPKPIPNCYWAEPGKLLAGEYPRSFDTKSSEFKIAALLAAGVTCLVDLTHPEDRLEPYDDLVARLADTDVSVQHFPIRDLSVPSSPSLTVEILDAIDTEICRGGLVYLHCWGGIGRTGVMVGCWLARHDRAGKRALERLQQLWRDRPDSHERRSPETPEQEDYIVNWNETGAASGRRRARRHQSHGDRARLRSRFRGTIFGLAVGDALGAPVEFLQRTQIIERYGSTGIADLAGWGGFPPGYYTDDTQMSLATATGLIRARHRWKEHGSWDLKGVVYRRYLAWRETQHDPNERRAPGRTCLSALDSGQVGTIERAVNHSKGCGGVMRTAPVGLALQLDDPFQAGAECAALTHGHPSGYLSAGYLSELIARLVRGCELRSAVRATRHSLRRYDGHAETLHSVDRALELADSATPVPDAIEQLGQGWVGEEALAIALFSALRHSADWTAATLAAVNHSGDSDSTGSICGAILGAALGVEAIPLRWIEQLENRALLDQTARDMYAAFVEDKIMSFDLYPPD